VELIVVFSRNGKNVYGCAKLILFHVHEETCVFGNDFSLYVEMQSCGFR